MSAQSVIWTILIAILACVSIFGQTTIKPSVVTGDVISISEKEIQLKTDAGDITVELEEKTTFKRVPPENPKLDAAVDAAIADIGEGDKLLVTGVFSNDRKRLPARAVYLMTQGDISKRREEEARKWATRGTSGRVKEVDHAAGKITMETRGLTGAATTTIITPKDKAVFKRYAKDSNKYSEAEASSIASVQPGDMIRALGDRSADGTEFAAEEIVTGAFHSVVGVIKSIDAAAGEVVLEGAEDEPEVVVVIGRQSALRKLPEDMMTRMMGLGGGLPGAGGRPMGQGGQQGRPAGGQPTGGQGRPMGGAPGEGQRMMRPGGAGGVDEMFERFPAININDLKPGDMIAVSSTKGDDQTRFTAIKLLAGVEPFVQAAALAEGGTRRTRTAQSGGFTIPGFDGLDFP